MVPLEGTCPRESLGKVGHPDTLPAPGGGSPPAPAHRRLPRPVPPGASATCTPACAPAREGSPAVRVQSLAPRARAAAGVQRSFRTRSGASAPYPPLPLPHGSPSACGVQTGRPHPAPSLPPQTSKAVEGHNLQPQGWRTSSRTCMHTRAQGAHRHLQH